MNDLINKLNKEYFNKVLIEETRTPLVQEYNIMLENIKGYHGREILELLQNADDANVNYHGMDKKVTIEYKDNILTISNTGKPFDKEGVKSIIQGNVSYKNEEYIGNKGTGFRSVVNWSNKVQIFSRNLAIEFSEKFCEESLNEIKDEPQIKREMEKNNRLKIPMLSIAKNIDKIELGDYATKIKIYIVENKNVDEYNVLNQLKKLDHKILLFLQHINEIKIIIDNEEVIYSRYVKNNDSIKNSHEVLLRYQKDNNIKEEIYYLFEKEYDNLVKEYGKNKKVKYHIAIPKDYSDFKVEYMYSYFPISNVRSPFNCLMNGTYGLSQDRNSINKSKNNLVIFKHHINFLIEIIEAFANNDMFDYVEKLIVPLEYNEHFTFPSMFYSYTVDNYIDDIKDLKVLKTTSNKYISFMDKPKIIKIKYPDIFKMNKLDNLINFTNESNVIDFIKSVEKVLNINFEYTEEELLNNINKFSKELNIEEHITIYLWWEDNYQLSLPKLLKDIHGNFINFRDECVFFEGKSLPTVPRWVKYKVLDNNYQKELIKQIKVNKRTSKIKVINNQFERAISTSNLFNTVDFAYRDRNTIISTINSSVDNSNKALEYIMWLWDNYKDQDDYWLPPENINYNFVNQNDKLIKSNLLYLDSSYKSKISEKLFSYNDDFQPLISFEKLNIDNDDLNTFKKFIIKFGVLIFPIETTITNPSLKFKKYIKNRITKHEGISDVRGITYDVRGIKDIEKIIQTLETKDIVEWIYKDDSLRSKLETPIIKNSGIKYNLLDRRTAKYTYYQEIYNYTYYMFSSTRWITINKKKYKPNELHYRIINSTIEKHVPYINDDYINDIALSLSFQIDEVERIFNYFEFVTDVIKLPSELFYKLLNELSTLPIDSSQEAFRHIYSRIDATSNFKEFDESKEKQNYFREGKMLVMLNNKLTIHNVSKSYTPSIKIFDSTNVPIVYKQQRTNNEIFKKVFNCNIYKSEVKLVKDGIVINEEINELFQKQFILFMKYAAYYKDDNAKVKDVYDKLNVVIVKHLDIDESGIEKRITTNNYLYREKDELWYIVFNDSFDLFSLSLNIEKIFELIANTPRYNYNVLGELFRAESENIMIKLIEKNFGEVLNDDIIVSGDVIRDNFIKALDLKKTISLDHIDFNRFNYETIKHIIEILKLNNISLEILKINGFKYNINIKKYNQELLKQYLELNSNNFKNYLYSKAYGTKTLEDDFLKTYQKLMSLDSDFICDKLYFSPKEYVFEKFNIDENIFLNPTYNASIMYDKHIGGLNINKKLIYEIGNNDKVRTFVYFNRIEDYYAWEKDYLRKKQDDNDLENHIIEIKELTNFEFLNTELNDKNSTTTNNANGGYDAEKEKKQRKRNKSRGNKAELLIYNYLVNKYGDNKVTGVSEAFVEMKINAPGKHEIVDYDIKYIDETNKVNYVEVKSTTANFVYITKNEYEFAKENPNNYYLYVVNLEEKSFFILPKMFWKEKDRFPVREVVEKYTCKFNVNKKISH